MIRLLAVCTGNTCRSPMLEALLRARLIESGRSDVEIESAGTGASDGATASPEAAAVMARRGLSLVAHRSRNVRSLDLNTYTHCHAMTPSHVAALRSLGVPAQRLSVIAAERGGIADPFGGTLADYEACALELDAAATRILAGLPPAVGGPSGPPSGPAGDG